MALLRAQIVLPMFTNTPDDVITNTLYFDQNTIVSPSVTIDAITPMLQAFYEAIYKPDRMANYVIPGNATVRWYNMTEPEPRVPVIKTLPMTSIVTQASTVPTEASIVLSFQGERAAGVPQARRRGRIYLGGLANPALASSSPAAFPTVGSGIRNSIVAAAEELRDDVGTAAATWVVWSPTTSSATEVVDGWVDNAIDTQRRRDVERTARTLWP